MNQTSSKEPQHQDKIALEDPPVLAEGTRLVPEDPPIITEGTRLAPAPADHGPGSCADGHDGDQPVAAAALTGDNGGGTSGNHGNGTAG